MRKDRDDNQNGGDNPGDALPDLPGITLTPQPLSRGPLGNVYRGWDQVHRCEVIVKTQRVSGDRVATDRFRREAAVMARLRHPNIVALYRFQDGDPAVLVMEYVPGRTLADLVATGGPLAPARAVGIIEGVAAALDRIHLEGIVHRDVKPSNILLPPHGPAKLTDFGVAHTDEGAPLTVVGDILGTIEYVSPEQVHGETAPDARSDVYSLAAVTYFALAGVPPFPAADNSTQAQLSVMHRQVFADPPPLTGAGLSSEVAAAVLRGLAKAPDARPASAGQFAAGLRSAVEAGRGTPEEQATAAGSRRTALLSGAAAGATLLLLGGLAAWKMEQPAPLSGPAPPSSGHPPVAAAPSSPARRVLAPMPAPKVASKPAVRPVAAAHPAPVRVAVAASRQERRPPPQLNHKMPVTERPRFRRHPDVVARAVPSAPPRPALIPLASKAPASKPIKPLHIAARPFALPGQAWLSVYARQNAAAVPARLVTVDGRPMPSLAAGGWAALPAGRHLISYVPAAGSGFNPNPGLWITLASGAHVTRQILLPATRRPRAFLAAAPPKPAAAAPGSPKPVTVPAAPPAVGWYTLSGWAATAAPEGGKSALMRAPAQWVKVDGQPVAELASGGWATLSAGKHTVTFQPALGLGVGPKTWNIDLTPQAHLQQQIPLPPAAPAAAGWYTVSGWAAQDPDAPKPRLVRVSAQWVKVDDQAVLGLALGQWATLPAGKHTVTLQPTPGLGLAPKTWDIDLTPQAHLDQKIPLSAASASK